MEAALKEVFNVHRNVVRGLRMQLQQAVQEKNEYVERLSSKYEQLEEMVKKVRDETRVLINTPTGSVGRSCRCGVTKGCGNNLSKDSDARVGAAVLEKQLQLMEHSLELISKDREELHDHGNTKQTVSQVSTRSDKTEHTQAKSTQHGQVSSTPTQNKHRLGGSAERADDCVTDCHTNTQSSVAEQLVENATRHQAHLVEAKVARDCLAKRRPHLPEAGDRKHKGRAHKHADIRVAQAEESCERETTYKQPDTRLMKDNTGNRTSQCSTEAVRNRSAHSASQRSGPIAVEEEDTGDVGEEREGKNTSTERSPELGAKLQLARSYAKRKRYTEDGTGRKRPKSNPESNLHSREPKHGQRRHTDMGDSLPSVRDTDSHGSKISRRHNNPLGTQRMTESYSPTPAHQCTKQNATESRITPSPFLAPVSPRRPVPTSCFVTETCLDSSDLVSPLKPTGRRRVTALQDISTVVVPETLGMDAISPEEEEVEEAEEEEEVEEVSSPVSDSMHGGTKGKAEKTARNSDNTVHERSSKPGRDNVERRMQLIRGKPGGGISHTHSSRQGSKTVGGTSPPTELSPESVRAHRSERRKENIEARSSQLKELSPDSVRAHRSQRRKKNMEARSLQQAEHSPETDASRSYTAGKGLEKNSLQPSAHSPTNSLHRHSTVPEDGINNHAGNRSHRRDKKDAEARHKHKQEMPKSGHSNAKQSVSSQGVWGTDSVVFTSTRPSSHNNPTRQSIDAGSLCLLGEESVGCSLQSPVFTAHHKDLDSPQGDQSPALFDEGSCDESLGTLVASAMDTDQSALDQRPTTPSTPPVEAAHTESPPSSSLLRPAVRQPLGQLSINVTPVGASFKLPSPPPHATRRERGNPSLHSPRSPPVAVGRQSLSPLHSPQSPPVVIQGQNLSPFHSPQSSPVIVRRENLNPLHSPQSPPSVVVGRRNLSPLHSPRSTPVVVRKENLNSPHSPPSPSVLVDRGTVNLSAVRNTLSPPQVTRQRTLDEMTNTVSPKSSPVSDGSELGTLKPAQPRKLFRSRKLQREPPSADDTINPELLVDVDIGDTVGTGRSPRAPVSSQLNASLDPAARLTQYLQTVAEEQPDQSQWDEGDVDVTMDPRFQQLHQTSAQDITLISQGGSELSLTCQPSTPRPATPILLDDSFDRVPERKKQEHTYAYAEVVRKQADRRKLKGFSCQECRQVEQSTLISCLNSELNIVSTGQKRQGRASRCGSVTLFQSAQSGTLKGIKDTESPHADSHSRSCRQELSGRKIQSLCLTYYSAAGLTEAEMAVRMAECSKHRARQAPPSTPDHFWSVGFPDTQECEEHDKIK